VGRDANVASYVGDQTVTIEEFERGYRQLESMYRRLYGEQSFKASDKGKELSDELADVLWVLLCIANQTGVDLTAALEKNFEKKNIRDAERHKENEKLR